jgi:hypothetical protein
MILILLLCFRGQFGRHLAIKHDEHPEMDSGTAHGGSCSMLDAGSACFHIVDIISVSPPQGPLNAPSS